MKNLKKLALLLTTVMMFFTLTACSSQPSTPTVPNPDTNGTSNSSASKNEVELVNRDGVKITIVGGLDTTGSVFGPQLKLRVENSSGHNITVQSRKTSVNGYTMGDFGAIMSIDVTNGEKPTAPLPFTTANFRTPVSLRSRISKRRSMSTTLTAGIPFLTPTLSPSNSNYFFPIS